MVTSTVTTPSLDMLRLARHQMVTVCADAAGCMHADVALAYIYMMVIVRCIAACRGGASQQNLSAAGRL